MWLRVSVAATLHHMWCMWWRVSVVEGLVYVYVREQDKTSLVVTVYVYVCVLAFVRWSALISFVVLSKRFRV